jgi:hypothetical protein
LKRLLLGLAWSGEASMETSETTVFDDADAKTGGGLDLALDDTAVFIIIEGEPGTGAGADTGITAIAASEAGGEAAAVRVGVA